MMKNCTSKGAQEHASLRPTTSCDGRKTVTKGTSHKDQQLQQGTGLSRFSIYKHNPICNMLQFAAWVWIDNMLLCVVCRMQGVGWIKKVFMVMDLMVYLSILKYIIHAYMDKKRLHTKTKCMEKHIESNCYQFSSFIFQIASLMIKMAHVQQIVAHEREHGMRAKYLA